LVKVDVEPLGSDPFIHRGSFHGIAFRRHREALEGNGGEANGVSLHFSISRLDWIVLADPRRFEDLWLEEPFE
jgi:hypothetical protein